jgi:hypothetical protein
VPLDLKVVISRLKLKPRMSTPPLLTATPWEPRPPSNAFEINAQSTLLQDRVRTLTSSSSPVLELVQQLRKGAEIIVHSSVLLADEVGKLRAALAAASERKKRKKKRIQ